MKITTRILTGYGMFVVVLVGLVVYQITTVFYYQSTIEDVEVVNSQNVEHTIQALKDHISIEDFTKKSLTVDPGYTEILKEFIKSFEVNLKQLESGAGSDVEHAAVIRLEESWEEFKQCLTHVQQYLIERELNETPPLESGAGSDDEYAVVHYPAEFERDFNSCLERVQQDLPEKGLEETPPPLLKYLARLKSQSEYVLTAISYTILDTISKINDQSEDKGDEAQVVLVSILVMVLFVTILVSLLIVRSISKPLAHLTEGTRAITEGKYYYRLDSSRNDEFSQLAKDFNTMIRRLSELDELKKDFISHVSHELKSPLASMRETVQLLIDQIPGPLTDKQKRLLELNLQSGDRLTSMIRNLLDLSKIEAGTVEYELKRQDLVPLVRTAINVFEVQASERRIRIERSLPEAPLLVKCDSDRIVQVIVNLVGNAVKFSPDGAVVRIRLEPVSEIPETMPKGWRSGVMTPEPPECFGLLSIADSGPGIPDSDKFRVFEKFHQIQKGKKVAAGQGVGLGLAICRTIVQAHHGAVWVEDNPGGGCCFYLLLSPGSEDGVDLRASQPI